MTDLPSPTHVDWADVMALAHALRVCDGSEWMIRLTLDSWTAGVSLPMSDAIRSAYAEGVCDCSEAVRLHGTTGRYRVLDRCR